MCLIVRENVSRLTDAFSHWVCWGRIPDAPVNHALIKNYSIVGVHWGLFRRLHPEKAVEIHEDLMSLYEQGLIKPLIFREFDFKDVPSALDVLADRQTYGKLVALP